MIVAAYNYERLSKGSKFRGSQVDRRNGMSDACELISQVGPRGEQGLVHDSSALDHEQLACHKVTIGTGQEEGGAGNILG